MKAAAWLILGAGIALRLVAWTQRSSLWLDEVAMALNVSSRSMWDLLALPLDYGQAAPKGFLLLQWVITHLVGTSALAYRLLPFLAGVAALFVFRNVSRRVLADTGALVAQLFFALGFWFVFYSAEAKPYMLDLTLSLLMLSLAFDFRDSGYARANAWRLATTGFVAVWLSNGAVLTLFALALALGFLAVRERGARWAARALLPVGVTWSVAGIVVVWVELRGQFPGMVDYLHRSNASLFAPLPRGLDAALWFWREWRYEMSMWHGWAINDSAWTALFPALALIGLGNIAWRRRYESVLLLMPIATFMVASMAQRYPYGPRFALFPLSLLVLGVGEVADRISHFAADRAAAISRTATLLLCVPALYFVAAYPPPYPWTAVGSYLERIRSQWLPGDVLYVSFGRALEVLYHAPRFGIDLQHVTFGPCDFSDPRAVLRSIDGLRGRPRVWVIVDPGAAFPPVDYAYLRSIGIQRESVAVQPAGTRRLTPSAPFDIETAYLFDLSDSARLGQATAEDYRRSPWLARLSRPSRQWECRGVFAPFVRESEEYRRVR